MSRISDAFHSFFSILFQGQLSADLARRYGYSRTASATPAVSASGASAAAAPAKAQLGASDGAIFLLNLLQRDARLVDFLMEDLSAYSDQQVGAAAREVQAKSRETLARHLKLAPVIDAVEGDYTKTQGISTSSYRLVGNVPPSGKAPGGLLRHRGWKAEKVELPAGAPGEIIAPAEIEVE